MVRLLDLPVAEREAASAPGAVAGSIVAPTVRRWPAPRGGPRPARVCKARLGGAGIVGAERLEGTSWLV